MKTSYLILAGVCTGAILLLTSDKGRKLSKSMVNSSGELKGKLAKLFKNLNAEMLQFGKVVSDKMCQLTGQVKDKVVSAGER